MKTRFMAIVETGLTADHFRKVCASLEIDSDQPNFSNHEITQIRQKSSEGTQLQPEDTYSAAQAAEIIGVSGSNFGVTYSPKAVKVKTGYYTKESIHQLAELRQEKQKKKNTLRPPQEEKRIQRISVSEDDDGRAIVSIYLENISSKEALQMMIDALTKEDNVKTALKHPFKDETPIPVRLSS